MLFAFNSHWADARTVRPYMLQNMQLVHKATYLLVNCAGTDARTVRPYRSPLPYCVAIGLRWILKYNVIIIRYEKD